MPKLRRSLRITLAIENPPTVEVTARRVGGATYRLSGRVRPQRRISLSAWIIDAAPERAEKSMAVKARG